MIVVLAVECLHDRRADLPCADDEDLHGARRVHRPGDRGARSIGYRGARCIVSPPPLRALVAVLVGASGASATAHRERARPRRRSSMACRRRCTSTAAPGVARTRSTSSSRAGSIRVVRARQDAGPSRSSTSARQVAPAASRGCSGSRSHPTTRRAGSSSSTTRTSNGAHARRALPRRTGRRRCRGARGKLLFVKQPYANHNGGMVALRPGRPRLRRHGRRWLGRRSRRTAPRTRARCSARSSGSIPRGRAAKPVIVASRSPQPVAVLVRPRERRPLDRRRRSGLDRGGRSRRVAVDRGLLNFGWDVYEAGVPFESKPLGPGHARASPSPQYSHSRGCSITGGYVYRGSAVPAPLAGTSTATTAAARCGR